MMLKENLKVKQEVKTENAFVELLKNGSPLVVDRLFKKHGIVDFRQLTFDESLHVNIPSDQLKLNIPLIEAIFVSNYTNDDTIMISTEGFVVQSVRFNKEINEYQFMVNQNVVYSHKKLNELINFIL